MTGPDPQETEPGKTGGKPPDTGEETPKAGENPPRPWVRPALAGFALVLVAAGVGFGIGYATKPADAGPQLDGQEAFNRMKEETAKEVRREMVRRGFDAGRRSGRNHGIIAGGMAAESAVTILVREQQAASAQSEAASAQAELAGISAAPAPPVPEPEP